MRAPPHILSPVTPPGSLSPWGPHGVGGGRPRALVSLPGADQTGSPASLSLKKCIQAVALGRLGTRALGLDRIVGL